MKEEKFQVETAPTQRWYTPLTHNTPVSRTLAALLFTALPFMGFWLGVEWATREMGKGNLPVPQPGIVECQADAKLCPDGSAVGRVGPDCEFAECPEYNNDEKTVVQKESGIDEAN